MLGLSDVTYLRELLKPAERADKDERCMDGTRLTVLKQIDDWARSVETPNILWLKATAGADKTAIAASVLGQHRGPRFFFKRDNDYLNNPMALWRTIAYDLARRDAIYLSSIDKRVKEYSLDPREISVEEQFKYLIEGPATECVPHSQGLPVVVVDALDECRSDSDLSGQWEALLVTIKKWSTLPRTFKLFVTSRDQRDIEHALVGVSQVIALQTGDNVTSETQEDIQSFLEKRLARIGEQFGPVLPASWLGKHIVQRLTIAAQGLFIWAKVTMDYLEQDPGTLDAILDGHMDHEGNPIDKLYHNVLQHSFEGPGGKLLPAFKMVAGIIVLAKTPLILKDIHHFLSTRLGAATIQSVIFKLKAIVPSGSLLEPLHVCHQSLPEFLLDVERSGHFAIDKVGSSEMFALACLQHMNDEKGGLRFNICGLETSYLLNSEISNLEKRVGEAIPSSLLYSCQFWMEHLRDISKTTVRRDFLPELSDFFYHKILFWFEVLSLTGAVSSAPNVLRQVAQWIGVSTAHSGQTAADHNTNRTWTVHSRIL